MNKAKRAAPDRCSCGNPFAYEIGKTGRFYWCWLCDGHGSDCKRKQQPWGSCRCVNLRQMREALRRELE